MAHLTVLPSPLTAVFVGLIGITTYTRGSEPQPEPVKILRPGKVVGVAFSPDGRLLATGGGHLKISEVATGKEIRKFTGHGFISAVAFSPDGKTLATGGGTVREPAEVKLWDVDSGKILFNLPGPEVIAPNVAFSPDGTIVAAGCGKPSHVLLWDAKTGKLLRSFTGHTKEVGSFAFTPDGKQIASSGGEREVRLWDVETCKEVRASARHSGFIPCVAFTPDGKALLTASFDGFVTVYDLPAFTYRDVLTGVGKATAYVAASADGKYIAASYLAGHLTIRVWHRDGGRHCITIRDDGQNVIRLAFSPDSKLLAAASPGGTVRLWRVADLDAAGK